MRDVFSHFSDFLPVARYEVEVRNHIQKVDHSIDEIVEASFRMPDELHSLATNIVCVGIHSHVKHNGIGKRNFTCESRSTWKKRDK